MQKSEHTALPWTAEKLGSIVGGDAEQYVNGSKQKQLAMVTANFGSDQQQANAAYIVRACNVHYELLEALKWALTAIAKPERTGHNDEFCSGYELAEIAIQKAESE